MTEVAIFPYPLTEKIETLDDMDYSKNKVLKSLVVTKRIVIFLIYSLCGRISTSNTSQTTNLARYFKNQTKAALHLNRFVPDKFQWEKVEQRLNGTNDCQKKNNTDVRTCFKIDNNKFSVPGLFTFGQRTVPPGCVHVLETTVAPMFAYKLSAEAIKQKKVVLKESSFDAMDETWYFRYVLQPNTRYQFDVGTTYLFVTVQKSLFSLHVLENPEGRIYGVNPFQHTKLLNDPYQVIPQTPRPVLPPTIGRETTFLAPSPPETIFLAPAPAQTTIPSIDIFQTPLPISKKRPREEEDVTPISNKRPREEEDVTPISNKRPREEEDVTPRIIKITKGPYDYPHPDVSTEWCREDERIKRQKPQNHLSVQTEPINYSCLPRCEVPVLIKINTYLHDFLEEMNELVNEQSNDPPSQMENGVTEETDKLESEQSIDFSFLDEEIEEHDVSNEDIDEFFKDLY